MEYFEVLSFCLCTVEFLVLKAETNLLLVAIINQVKLKTLPLVYYLVRAFNQRTNYGYRNSGTLFVPIIGRRLNTAKNSTLQSSTREEFGIISSATISKLGPEKYTNIFAFTLEKLIT
jgi:hypothetical protein